MLAPELRTETISDEEFEMMIKLFRTAHKKNLGEVFNKRNGYLLIRAFLKDAGYFKTFQPALVFKTTRKVFDRVFSSAGYVINRG